MCACCFYLLELFDSFYLYQQVYLKPIKDSLSSEEPILNEIQIQSIFFNVEEIRAVGEKMLEGFHSCKQSLDQLYGQVFLDNVPPYLGIKVCCYG